VRTRSSFLGFWRLLALGVALLAWGCKPTPITEPGTPQPGTLTLSIRGSGGQGHAFLIEITGQASAPTAVDATHLLYHTTTGSGIGLILIGAVQAGPVARFQVPDIGQAASYTAQIVEVADDLNRLLTSSSFTAQIDS
jgi:hypothetical protein